MNPAEFANVARAEQDFWWYRGMRRILFRMIDPVVGARRVARVLEAGCGTGYFAAALQARYHCPVFPIDLAPEGLRHSRVMRFRRLAQADIGALPFPDGIFDLILSLDVIVHFPRGEEWKPMAELARVLTPGGLLVMRVAALDALRSRHSQFALERQRFTRARLVRLAHSSGLRVLRCSYANTFLLPVALLKFRVWEPLLRKPPASGVEPVPHWLDRLLFAPLALESALLGVGLNLPLGQSLILMAEKAG